MHQPILIKMKWLGTYSDIHRTRVIFLLVDERLTMQIVTDSGTDYLLSLGPVNGMRAHVVPLVVTYEGKTYREGIDIETSEFYKLLEKTNSLPITSQPSAGVFAETYRQLAANDPDILSIHISSGLSGTVNTARAGAAMVPEAHVTVVDTLTLSAASGWEVEAALRAANAGWGVEKILPLLDRIRAASHSMYTLTDLKYLIHGGRISHMKGLIASLLKILPIIGVEKQSGKYVQMGQTRSFNSAVDGLVNLIAKQFGQGSTLRVQVLHAQNPEGASLLHDAIDRVFKCNWLPIGSLSLVLGAHTGPSMVGVAFGSQDAFDAVP
jgi:DegV family protein with EDD domain